MSDQTNMNNATQEQQGSVQQSTISVSGNQLVGIIVAVLGIAAAIAGSFMPLFKIGILMNMTAFEGDFRIGSIVAIAALAIVLVMILRNDGGMKGYCFAGALAACGEALVHYLYANERMATVSVLGVSMDNFVTMESGFYVMMAGGILLLIGGCCMPKMTKKVQPTVMICIVIALIIAGVVITYAFSSSDSKNETSSKKTAAKAKDEKQAKSDDITAISAMMSGADICAIDPELIVPCNAKFTIAISQGSVTLSYSAGSGSLSEVIIQNWKDTIKQRDDLDMSRGYEIQSEQFGSVNGTIVGTVTDYGDVIWQGEGVSALTSFSSWLRSELR